MKNNGYSITLADLGNNEGQRAAQLLDGAQLSYERARTNFAEPRLHYRIGDQPAAEVIGLHEIKEIIPFILEEVAKQQAA